MPSLKTILQVSCIWNTEILMKISARCPFKYKSFSSSQKFLKHKKKLQNKFCSTEIWDFRQFKNRNISISFPLLPHFYLLSRKEVYLRYSRIPVRPAFQINSNSWYCDQPVSSLVIHWTFSSFGFIPARLNQLGAACYMANETWTDTMQFCNLLSTFNSTYCSHFVQLNVLCIWLDEAEHTMTTQTDRQTGTGQSQAAKCIFPFIFWQIWLWNLLFTHINLNPIGKSYAYRLSQTEALSQCGPDRHFYTSLVHPTILQGKADQKNKCCTAQRSASRLFIQSYCSVHG